MMELWFTDRLRLVLLVGFCGLLASVESLVPLLQYRRGRLRRALPNFALAAGVFLINFALASVAASLSALVTRNGIGLLAPLRAHLWPLLIAGVVVLDLSGYVAHLLMHKIPLGWRFHQVHHSELEVDVTTAFRQHPGETLWRFLWQCVAIAVFGLPFWIVPLYLSLSALNSLAEHANVRMGSRLDRWMRLLLVTPPMHKIHHSRVVMESNSNYSNIFSIWDHIFGTYTGHSNQQVIVYGLDGCDKPQDQTLSGLLGTPFRPS
jgi:sterol desaturase/sphingolipid hydroxylase (fatty acid hydroxylase superfamily)